MWTAEYQESDAILLNPDKLEQMKQICEREKCQLSCVGNVNGNHKVLLKDFQSDENLKELPVDLDLRQISERLPKVNF